MTERVHSSPPRSCLLAPHRNQPLDHDSIDHLLQTFFQLKRVVWLDHGNLIGDDTDGHIDTIVRVAPHDTLLYVGCDNPEDEQYEDFQALEKQLKGLFTWEGYPYRLLKLPMPDPIYDEGDCLTTNPESEGDRLPATYANFLILNKAVIYPTYNQPEKGRGGTQADSARLPRPRNHRCRFADHHPPAWQHPLHHHAVARGSPQRLNIPHLTFNI